MPAIHELEFVSSDSDTGSFERGGRASDPPAEQQKNVRMVVTVSDEEIDAYREAAARVGLSVSEWVRQTLGRALRKVRRNAP